MDMFANTVGWLALAITLVSFSRPSDGQLQKLNLAGCLLWAGHFVIMKEWAAGLMMLVACVMVGSAILRLNTITNFAWIFNILLIPVMSTMIVTGGAGWVAILPVLGGFFINTGVSRCAGYGMTVTITLGHLLWIAAAVLMGSVPAIIANALNILGLMVREILRRRQSAPSGAVGAEA